MAANRAGPGKQQMLASNRTDGAAALHPMFGVIRFSSSERSQLLNLPRVGPGVVDGLERVGIASLADLRTVGVPAAVERICLTSDNKAWRNRIKALERALRAQHGDDHRPTPEQTPDRIRK